MALNVGMTLYLDWSKEFSNPDILSLLDTVEVDCYGTDHATQLPCWIIQGTTNDDVWLFVNALQLIWPTARILHLSFTPSPSTARQDAAFVKAFGR